MLPEFMPFYPTVFAVGDTYRIFIPFTEEAILWIRVGESTYYDHVNGVLRSAVGMHRVDVPMSVLDAAGEYTVVYRKMTARTPYYPQSEAECAITIPFRPVPSDGDIHIYHISDAHDMVREPIAAGCYFGDELDLLVLNGDLCNHSGDPTRLTAACEIASGITEGRRATVFSRGNHDARGAYAEILQDYTPTKDGKTYYSFRVGGLWGLVLDCGEDKRDEQIEYGGTVCFHAFREEETAFIRRVIENAEREYAAEGVRHKLVISHMGFTHVLQPPFDIEQELYREWARLMREQIKPDLLLHGHYHTTRISPVGSDFDHLGQPCPAVIGSRPIFDKNHNHRFVGCALTLSPDGHHRVVFNDSLGQIIGDEVIE